MFRDTCWDARTNRFVCKDGSNYINPTVAPRRRCRSTTSTRRRPQLHVAHGAARRRRAARRGRDAAVQRARRASTYPIPPAPPSASRSADARWRAEKVVVRDLLIVGMGDSFALGRRQSGRAGALLARALGRLRQAPGEVDLTGYPGTHRSVEADRRQGVHRGERPLDRSGMPSLALFPPAARGPAARHRGSASRRDLRRRRLLGLGGHVRPVPALHRQRMGAQSARHVADLRHRVGAVRRCTRRRCRICPRPITWTAPSPS